ncbi:methyltransferase [Marinibaculum pumilum]|uniref:Methyltransferase n=1 Tax=Marinibaculum pumilum TaxID=1766165 RepID=A0ABV7KU80_9PROT
MESIRTAEEISTIAFGFMASKALFSALHVGVFDALAKGPMGVDALAKATGIQKRRLTTLLTALVASGLVEKDGSSYSNAPGAQDYLVQDAKAYFGDYLRYQIDRQMFPMMTELVPVLEKGEAAEAPDYEAWMADPNEARLFSESQHSGSLGPGAVLAKMVELEGAKSLLDVGGGTGAFAIMFAKRYPGLATWVLDFANVCEVGKTFVEKAGMSDRVGFIPGNAIESEFPPGQDAILMSYLLGGVPADTIPGLVDKAYASLKPGGMLIVHDFMVEDDRSGPPLAALWALQHMVYTPEGMSLTAGGVRQQILKSGFEEPRIEVLIAGMTKVLIAKKPAA